MPYNERYLKQQILADLPQKMVFVGGPRQVGKTTLAQNLPHATTAGYLNWDIAAHKEAILKQQLPNTDFWIFDELHKYADWRGLLKGLYDEFSHARQILVTGSARLDYYRRGGDSLQGRYHYLRMHPLSVAELGISKQADFNELLQLGGFPEPFFSSNEIEAKRWTRQYRQRLIQEDLLSLEHIKNTDKLELLMIRLPALVGSPLSINALREDLQVSHGAVSNWLSILEKLYGIFRLAPFGAPIIRAVKKEQKHYHYDWTLPEHKGARFENLVASHLLKWVHFEQDTKARDLKLCYFRDIDSREVDFIITENNQPIQAIECKYKDPEISKHLTYFKKRFPGCEAWQLLAEGDHDFVSSGGIHVCSAVRFLGGLI